MVDKDDRQCRIYELVSMPSYVSPSYVSLLSCKASDPVYFVLVEKTGQATAKLQHRYGHVILRGQFYLEGWYLHKSRSRHPNQKKFKVPDHNVYISPGEIFETSVEFDDDLTMGTESYSKYLNLA